MARRTRLSAPTSDPATAAVTSVRPDPEVYGLARLYANGDVRRLRVLDPCTVLVMNTPG